MTGGPLYLSATPAGPEPDPARPCADGRDRSPRLGQRLRAPSIPVAAASGPPSHAKHTHARTRLVRKGTNTSRWHRSQADRKGAGREFSRRAAARPRYAGGQTDGRRAGSRAISAGTAAAGGAGNRSAARRCGQCSPRSGAIGRVEPRGAGWQLAARPSDPGWVGRS